MVTPSRCSSTSSISPVSFHSLPHRPSLEPLEENVHQLSTNILNNLSDFTDLDTPPSTETFIEMTRVDSPPDSALDAVAVSEDKNFTEIQKKAQELSQTKSQSTQKSIHQLYELAKEKYPDSDIEITSSLEKQEGSYLVKPFSLKNSQDINYKIQVSYKFKIIDRTSKKLLEGTSPVIFSKEVYTTAKKPQEAIYAASLYKNAMVKLAQNQESSSQESSSMSQAIFSLSLSSSEPVLSYKKDDTFIQLPGGVKKSSYSGFIDELNISSSERKMKNAALQTPHSPLYLPKEVLYSSKREAIFHRGYKINKEDFKAYIEEKGISQQKVEDLKKEIETKKRKIKTLQETSLKQGSLISTEEYKEKFNLAIQAKSEDEKLISYLKELEKLEKLGSSSNLTQEQTQLFNKLKEQHPHVETNSNNQLLLYDLVKKEKEKINKKGESAKENLKFLENHQDFLHHLVHLRHLNQQLESQIDQLTLFEQPHFSFLNGPLKKAKSAIQKFRPSSFKSEFDKNKAFIEEYISKLNKFSQEVLSSSFNSADLKTEEDTIEVTDDLIQQEESEDETDILLDHR